MCVFVCLYVEPVSRSKDYVWSWIKIGSVLCLCTPVSRSVPEMYGIKVTWGHSFLRMCLWWSSCILYLHAGQVRVTVGDTGLYCRTCVTYFVGDSGLCCVCVMYFECWLTPLCVDSSNAANNCGPPHQKWLQKVQQYQNTHNNCPCKELNLTVTMTLMVATYTFAIHTSSTDDTALHIPCLVAKGSTVKKINTE